MVVNSAHCVVVNCLTKHSSSVPIWKLINRFCREVKDLLVDKLDKPDSVSKVLARGNASEPTSLVGKVTVTVRAWGVGFWVRRQKSSNLLVAPICLNSVARETGRRNMMSLYSVSAFTSKSNPYSSAGALGSVLSLSEITLSNFSLVNFSVWRRDALSSEGTHFQDVPIVSRKRSKSCRVFLKAARDGSV